MKTHSPKAILTIMPDYGEAYAWYVEEGDPLDRNIGFNIGDAVAGLSGERFTVSKELEEDFAFWQGIFECYTSSDSDNTEFYWKSFHEYGLILTKRLKKEIGDKAIVRYVKADEDPDCTIDEITIIE